ncbi:hypothetical protein [Agromyces silvae]|uniref:hypothetical protein n=1 Tax=Agromyces silvae TaxID=3388266 RepID=UPI00280BB897|nr:hypothetical protein [Agromyces protaetiae]
MRITSHRVMLAGLAVFMTAGLTLTGSLGASAAPYVAPASEPAPPSPAAQAAALVVADYVATHVRPVSPVLGDPDEDWNAFAGPSYEYWKGFPFAAGLAQWDCQINGEAHVELLPATAEFSAANVVRAYAADCGEGYQPTTEEVANPRVAGDGTPLADHSDAQPLGCATISGGSHCLSFSSTEVTGKYTWLGNLMYGRLRLGQASVVWPSCNSGTPRLSLPIHVFGMNNFVQASIQRNQSSNWSLAFDQANAQGVILGERSVYCEAA